MRALPGCALLLVPTLFACSSPEEQVVNWSCTITADKSPDYAQQLGCLADFEALAATPLDSSLPGARTVKVLVDQVGGDALYFQNTSTYAIHWEFASTHLSGNGKPMVPPLSQFNQTEYYSPSRRFILGAVTYYEGPEVWAYEIAPYDTASAEMIAKAYSAIAARPTSASSCASTPPRRPWRWRRRSCPPSVKMITTDELYAGHRPTRR